MDYIEQEFKIINTAVLEFLENQKTDWYAIKDSQHKLPLSDAVFCVQDIIRNYKFFQAIFNAISTKKTVSEKIVVVDAWSGTGILWIFALYVGADECVFIEENPNSLRVNQKLVEHLGYDNQSEFIRWDATKLELPIKYDILVSETLEATLWVEDFVGIINNLKQFWRSDSIIIPQKIQLQITELLDQEKDMIIQTKTYNTKEWFKKEKIILNPNVKMLEFCMKLDLYNGIELKTWDCSWFINKQQFNVWRTHWLFEFIDW